MSRPTPAQDAWKTPEIREAESALDRTTRKSQDLLKDLEKIRLKPVQRPDTPERIEALKTAASKPDAPAELRLVKRKVDAGEFKWEDVASGRAFADPEVRALATPKLAESKDIYEELEEGLTPEEVLEARAGSRNEIADSGRPAYPAGPVAPVGFSNEDPLASSTNSYQAPASDEPTASPDSPPESGQGRHAAPQHHPTTQPKPASQDDEFTNPLGDRGHSAPSAPPEPDQSRHAAPPQAPRFVAPEEDEFADPLGDRDAEPRRQDPPAPPSPPARRSRRDDRGGDDDDYFGNSLLS
ncbi:hypothetical protein [Amycolatopsis sp. NBC_01480]|uniref:hypothetical protein n=1 Tax=Amycolatopsis sp. NBC_01480 TaxID=2903562 RepID=UPI002E2A8A7C|nr:hypothetical protein [Amycolatopsis sp. NBC_01480]